MKNYLILCSFLFCAGVSAAQESEYDRLEKLSNVWIRQNESEDAWTFGNHDLRVNKYDVHFNLYGDSLIVYEKDFENSSDYELKFIENYFLVQKLTNDELVIHPLNVAAVAFLDPVRYSDESAMDARESLCQNYLEELKAAGKDEVKRKAVLLKYKDRHGLDVDVVSFKPETTYFEAVKIDSVDISLTWKVMISEDTERIEYNDMRWVNATNTYFFDYRFEDRKADQRMLLFLPPVIFKEEISEPEAFIKETTQDSLIRTLNEAPAGCYTGKFAPEGMALIEKACHKFGVNKAHDSGDHVNYSYGFRIYHEGKYTEFYRNKGESETYLQEDFFAFLDDWTYYVRTFEKVPGQPVVFPIAVKK